MIVRACVLAVAVWAARGLSLITRLDDMVLGHCEREVIIMLWAIDGDGFLATLIVTLRVVVDAVPHLVGLGHEVLFGLAVVGSVERVAVAVGGLDHRPAVPTRHHRVELGLAEEIGLSLFHLLSFVLTLKKTALRAVKDHLSLVLRGRCPIPHAVQSPSILGE